MGRLKWILSRKIKFLIHVSWGDYAICYLQFLQKNQASVNGFSHLQATSLANYCKRLLTYYILMEPLLRSILPRLTNRRLDLQEPTVPTTHSFVFIFKFILLRKGCWNCRHNLFFGNRWCLRPRKITIIQNHSIFFFLMTSYVIWLFIRA